jgi:hypothetical protein
VYVSPFPGPGSRWQISTTSGIDGRWRADGKEIFYLALDGTLMSVPMTLGPLPEIGKAQPLFQTRIEPTLGVVWHQYDVARDGRFLVNMPEAVNTPVTIVVDWPALRTR